MLPSGSASTTHPEPFGKADPAWAHHRLLLAAGNRLSKRGLGGYRCIAATGFSSVSEHERAAVNEHEVVVVCIHRPGAAAAGEAQVPQKVR